MKKTSLLTSLFVAGLILSVIAVNVKVGKADPTAVISVEPERITGKVGQIFTVDFKVSDVSDCYTWQIFIQYDTSILSYLEWWEGPFLKGNPYLTLESYGYYNYTDHLDLPDGPPNWGKLFDKNPSTYSDFEYSEVDGEYTLYKFAMDPVTQDSTIKRVDINMIYEAAASSGGDMYRIGYNTTSSAKKILVDWTSAETTLGTYVWEDMEAPTADGWDWWEDIDGLRVTVETDSVGGDPLAVFKWYEAWLTIHYERPRNPGTDVKTTGVLFGVTGQGAYPGVSGTGLLGTMKFMINSVEDTTLDIQGVIGPLTLTYLLDPSTADILHTKEDGYFFKPWPEDLYPDGIIDIRDLAIVGINFGNTEGEPEVWTNSPSAWGAGWTTPENAASSDDVYASMAKNAIETYSDYGFGTCGSVTKVEVGVEGYSEGGEKIRVRVSNDGGSSWSTTLDATLTASDTTTWLDFTSAFSWIPDMLLDANLLVEAQGIAVGGWKSTFVDWIPVRVNVIGPPEGDVDGNGAVEIMDLAMVAIKYGQIYL